MDFGETVIVASTGRLADGPSVGEVADALEFRMDLADDPLEALEDYDGDLPVIATNRPTWEGGEADDEGRLEALATAAVTPAVEAIDVELTAIRDPAGAETARTARTEGVSVIASIHDFERTPSAGVCRELLAEATARADVGKLAVTPTEPGDVLDLLAVTAEMDGGSAEAEKRVATVAMGELGRHSRVVAPLYGSCIAYGAVEAADATAPGQYDVSTLAELIADLEPRSG